MNALSCARLSGLVLVVALLLGLPVMAEDTTPPAPAAPAVTAAEALAAWMARALGAGCEEKSP